MENQDPLRDIAEIRSMMERSSKFLSLSGMSGVLAGIYALIGAGIAHFVLHYSGSRELYDTEEVVPDVSTYILLACVILFLAIGTAVLLSKRKADQRGERLWNSVTRMMVAQGAIPLVAGGLLVLIMIYKGHIELAAPFTLLFYGLALFSAGKFTYGEVKSLGLVQVALGLAGIVFPGYGLLLWALGFGVFHVIYGIYMHYKYER